MTSPRRRVLLTGAGGLLATDLAPQLTRAGYEVLPLTRADLDIARAPDVRAALDEVRPDIVVNAAAWADVDAAERRPDLAERANALGPEQLAVACRDRGAFLVHYGTDHVFEGFLSRPYRETDPPGPLSAYARTKLEGERRVRAILPRRHLILRVAFLYGAAGRSLVRTVLRAARERAVLEVVDDQVGSPTWTVDVGRATAALLDAGADGLVHVAAPDHASKHEVAEAAVELARRRRPLAARRVRPVSTASRRDPALRPPWSALDTSRLRDLTGLTLPPWRQSLRAFIEAHLDDLLAP